MLETIRANGYKACCPSDRVSRAHTLGVNPLPYRSTRPSCSGSGARISARTRSPGVDVRQLVARAANTFPTLAKTSANYANSTLNKMEAIAEGYS